MMWQRRAHRQRGCRRRCHLSTRAAWALPGGGITTLMLLLWMPLVRAQTTVENIGEDLRQAWISHRLEGKLDVAEERYLRIFESTAAIDLRARAVIGLGLVERDRGHLDQASQWWKKLAELDGVSDRWRESARRLRDQVDQGIVPTPIVLPQQRMEDLQEELFALREQVDTLSHKLEERGSALETREKVISDLRLTLQVREQREEQYREIQESRTWVLMEESIQQERNAERLRNFMIAEGLSDARTHLNEGRVGVALNELKQVLVWDPTNREALALHANCIRSIALWDGQGGVSLPETLRMYPDARLVEEAMAAYLETAKKRYREGDTAGAMGAYRRVIDEFVGSAIPISGEKVAEIFSAAERGLERCFSEYSTGVEAAALKEEQRSLLALLARGKETLLNQDKELVATESRVEQLSGHDPQRVTTTALETAQRWSFQGLQSKTLGDYEGARSAFEYVITTLDLFPELDLDGQVRARIEALLREIAELATKPVEGVGGGEQK